MNSKAIFTRSTALAVVFALPLGIGSVAAQESTSAEDETMAEKIEKADAPDTAETDTASTQENSIESSIGGFDAVVVTVGDAEILGSDVLQAIGTLPPTLRQQPTELLLPMALQQLVLRELILDRARSENLTEDPEFASMAEQASSQAQENTTVQFWLQREVANAVTDDTVNAAYSRMKENVQGELSPLEDIRPQIERELRRVAVNRIRADLQAQGPEITFAGQAQQASNYSDNLFCTAEYSPGADSGSQAGSEFAEMDLDGDGMVSQEEYRKCRIAASSK